jgi:hexokinase
MPLKINLAEKTDREVLNYIETRFNLSLAQIKRIAGDFRLEMALGLTGAKSSLKMIPAYVDKPSGEEKGKFIALDLGGTHLRILQLELKGKGRIVKRGERKIVLGKKYIKGTARGLFDFIARNIKYFVKKEGFVAGQEYPLGFTFSFPIKQTGIASGVLVHWTKGFSAQGVVGNDVVGLLNESFKRNGVHNVKVTALVNDTVGTLVAQSYKDPRCDIGVILGTGTNACYQETLSKICAWKGPKTKTGKMIVNIEWGNFNKIDSTVYDEALDKRSDNPGYQILEKRVSGMYLGEIARLIMSDLIRKKLLFGGSGISVLGKEKIFKTEYMSRIENDRSAKGTEIQALLKWLGIPDSRVEDRLLVKKICTLVATRGARISAAVLAGVITKIDPFLSRKHTIAVDGSVYEKHPGFAKNIKTALREFFGKKSDKIKISPTKDGSGIGAAIIASIA